MKLLCDGKIDYFVVAESLCGTTVSRGNFLGPEDTVHDTHFRERAKVVIELQLKVCFTQSGLCWWAVNVCYR